MRFKLNRWIKTSYFLNAVQRQPDETLRRIKYEIEPYKTYDTSDYIEATPNIEDLITNTTTFIPYTQEVLKELKDQNIPYNLNGCKSCGGRITQINIQVFEVVE